MAPPIRVLIVDDQRPFRVAATALLSLSDELEVVGVADSGRAAIAAVDAGGIDLVLMDVHMSGMNGVEAAARILARGGGITVVLCSTEPRSMLAALPESLAVPFIEKKDLDAERLVALRRPPG